MIKRGMVCFDRCAVEPVMVMTDLIDLPHNRMQDGPIKGHVVRPTDGTPRQWWQFPSNLQPTELKVLRFPARPRLATVNGVPAA